MPALRIGEGGDSERPRHIEDVCVIAAGRIVELLGPRQKLAHIPERPAIEDDLSDLSPQMLDGIQANPDRTAIKGASQPGRIHMRTKQTDLVARKVRGQGSQRINTAVAVQHRASKRGRVMAVDATKNTITVLVNVTKGNPGEEKTFDVTREAKIVVGDSRDAKLGDLKPIVQLKKAPPPAVPASSGSGGHLAVTSEPAGARILLDGKFVGTAPMTIDAITPGRHVVTLQGDRHKVSRLPGLEARVDREELVRETEAV